MILRKLFVFALALALLLCLAPAALAEEGDFQANVEVATPPVGRGVIIFNAKDAVEAFPDEEPGPAVYPVIVSAGQVYYAAYEDTVYNNGGLVYNNGGLVYNNNGTVYNNDGVTYNNGGTVFANGGEVFSGLGQVVHNGGAVYDFSTTFLEPFICSSR